MQEEMQKEIYDGIDKTELLREEYRKNDTINNEFLKHFAVEFSRKYGSIEPVLKNIFKLHIIERKKIHEYLGMLTSKPLIVSGAYIVLLTNPNSHNYPMGVAIKYIRERRCIDYNGIYGNNIPNRFMDLRPATNEEIVEFVKNRYKGMKKEIKEVKVPVKIAPTLTASWDYLESTSTYYEYK